MIDHWECTLVGRHLNCDRPACPNHVAAVPGDFNRRRPVCFGVLVEVSAHHGGLSRERVGYLLAEHEQTVRREETKALEKMRKELAA